MSSTIKEAIETGKTVDEAIEKALAVLGISRLEAEIEILSRETKGFLGIGSTLAKVRVTEKMTPEKMGAAYLSDLLKAMGVQDFHIETVPGVDSVQYIVVSPEDMGFAIGYHGDALDAISTVVALAVSKAAGSYVKAIVDINGYREKRVAVLKEYAVKAAQKASETGYVTVANPMKPYERMIIHSTVQEFADVVSWSEGEEPRRRVIIAPISKVRKVGDRYERIDRPTHESNRSGASFKSSGGKDHRRGSKSYGKGGNRNSKNKASSPAPREKLVDIPGSLYSKIEIPKNDD